MYAQHSWFVAFQDVCSHLRPHVHGRSCRFGIECPDHLEWSGWQPGGEYSRKLVVRNVSNHTVKFKYKLPRSKYFSMAFPEPVSLMAGMSVPLKVCTPQAGLCVL